MNGYITRISGIVPHTNKQVDIDVAGRNLIITGGNGSGKTSLLRAAYEKTVLIVVQKREADLPLLQHNLQEREKLLSQAQKGTTQYNSFSQLVRQTKSQIQEIEGGLHIAIPAYLDFSLKFQEKKALIQYFEDKRLVEITEAKAVEGLQIEIETGRNTAHIQKVGNKLEQHLLNLRARRSFAITDDKNQELADKISKWFVDFEENLQHLFEDGSAKLLFDTIKNKFSIQQTDKPPFTFQTLSAGYKAVFDIYAELLMRTEYFEISPADLEGVVFIDEIDSHLHVSLQRLILPFFTESFPNIQFIVTTHSPFVLQSTRDTLVYDLSKNESYIVNQVKSQNEILLDCLGVPAAMPVWAEQSLAIILNKYITSNADEISLAELKKELVEAGLEEFFPESTAKILEGK